MTLVKLSIEFTEYNMTSHAEEEEENELVVKRKKSKRKFDDCVLESDCLDEEEETMTGNHFQLLTFHT
ncbi:hypothetical protein MHYP_G00241360 [Metynnis hypsauchen]